MRHTPFIHQAPTAASPRKKTRYYAISAGRQTGIVTDVRQYRAAIDGYKSPRSRKFSTLADAEQWLAQELARKKAKAASQRRKRAAARKAKAYSLIQRQSPHVKKAIYHMDARDVFVVDIEFTGLSRDAEILQVSLMNGLGMIVCNQYFKPDHATAWDETIPIHHITPERVADEPSFQTYAPHLTSLLASAQAIVGYSTMQDISLLRRQGVTVPEKPLYLDVGEAFSYVHEAVTGQRTYTKLQDCAAYYGYGTTNWHDSLADTKATLYCFYAMLDDPEAFFRFHTLSSL